MISTTYTGKKNWNFEIYNLGVIIPGETINDSFIALSEVMHFLIKKGCLPIIVGGSQDLTLAMYNAYEKLEQTINTCAIDFRLDLGDIEKDATKDGFLSHLLVKDLVIYSTIPILVFKLHM